MSVSHLAVLGGPPEFHDPLHVGRPNIGDRERLRASFEEILDRAWFTNRGPVVQQFEDALRERFEVEHVVATANATLGLEIVTRAANVTGEVIVPSFTFAATAHAIQWQGLQPVFADINPSTYLIDPASVEALITPRTSAIIGVHVWGVGCPIEELTELAARYDLTLIFDAAHAMGCTHGGRPIGGNGLAEVFSFHATKYVNSFEGGAIATNDADLATQVRNMINFGFAGYDRVTSVGTNAKMTEICAAMGLASLEAEPRFAAQNRLIWDTYREHLADADGLVLYEFPKDETNSHQYVVVDVEPGSPLTRNEIVALLQAEQCLARRYFYPGVHRMEPYASLAPMTHRWLPNTEMVTQRVMVLPTGTGMTVESTERVCELIRAGLDRPDEVRHAVASSTN